MNKIFNEPSFEVVEIKVEDIITTSNPNLEENETPGADL